MSHKNRPEQVALVEHIRNLANVVGEIHPNRYPAMMERIKNLIKEVETFKKANTIIHIGWLGQTRCYLNVPLEEAIERWMKSEDTEDQPTEHMISTITVTDEWQSYDGAYAP